MTPANRIAGHHGDDGFGKIFDDFLQVEGIQAGHTILAHITAFTAHTLIAAGAEGPLTLAGKNNYANLGIFATIGESVDQFSEGLWAKGVVHLGTIDGDFADAFGLF